VLRKIELLLLFWILALATNQVLAQKFAVIGDYGDAGSDELAVANLVKSWSPEFIITAGDNNYDDGEASTIDQNIGQYYHGYIKPYLGNTVLYGNGSPDVNRFFPVPGNHDWDSQSDLDPYLDYFTLPYNPDTEIYYDFVWGDVHFFMIDSDERTPDGIDVASTQAMWIKNEMESSTVKWKIVVLHRPPYNSTDGYYPELRWPFKLWGADAVIAGHKHNYERLIVDDLVYFVNGLGGKSKQSFGSTTAGSEVRYNGDYGAMLVEATFSNIIFSFYNTSTTQVDSYEINDPLPVELVYFTGNLNGNSVELRWRTETEVNNYGFSIERTTENSDWLALGFAEGHGNSNSPNQYTFSDFDIYQSSDYNYRLKQTDNDGTFEYSDVITVIVGVPILYSLGQNYPNPFNPETRIDYTLPEKQLVSLRIYNSLGELVRELVSEIKEAGSYSVMFDASNLSSGIYIYMVRASEFSENKKMILLK
jgi:hypothetical protein